uniref:Uncharacterized protein n=1 Tax=Lepeophtheirus salmonis TaxID=72036 RepID=A0A0K2USJ2_LEPSM
MTITRRNEQKYIECFVRLEQSFLFFKCDVTKKICGVCGRAGPGPSDTEDILIYEHIYGLSIKINTNSSPPL